MNLFGQFPVVVIRFGDSFTPRVFNGLQKHGGGGGVRRRSSSYSIHPSISMSIIIHHPHLLVGYTVDFDPSGEEHIDWSMIGE